jgi:hypothetical protein
MSSFFEPSGSLLNCHEWFPIAFPFTSGQQPGADYSRATGRKGHAHSQPGNTESSVPRMPPQMRQTHFTGGSGFMKGERWPRRAMSAKGKERRRRYLPHRSQPQLPTSLLITCGSVFWGGIPVRPPRFSPSGGCNCWGLFVFEIHYYLLILTNLFVYVTIQRIVNRCRKVEIGRLPIEAEQGGG